MKWKEIKINQQGIVQKFLEDPFIGTINAFKNFYEKSADFSMICYKGNLIKIGTWLHPALGPQLEIWRDPKKWNNSLWAFLLDRLEEIGIACGAGELEIYWMPVPIPKHYNQGSFMVPGVWNTGSCLRLGPNHTEILLNRQQEVLKVLCHECFHWIRVATPLENPELSRLWKEEHQWISRGPLLLEEAYVEALASIWFPRWVSTYFHEKHPSMREIISYSRKLCSYVRDIWADGRIQCGKGEQPLTQNSCSWSQQTNVFSYVFWKLFLLENPMIRKFLELPVEMQFHELWKEPQIRLQYQILCYQALNEDWPEARSYRLPEIRFLPPLHVPQEYQALC